MRASALRVGRPGRAGDVPHEAVAGGEVCEMGGVRGGGAYLASQRMTGAVRMNHADMSLYVRVIVEEGDGNLPDRGHVLVVCRTAPALIRRAHVVCVL